MKTGRRFFLSGVAATLAGTRALLAADQGQQRRDPLRTSPNTGCQQFKRGGRQFPFLRGQIQKCSSRKTRKN